MPENKVARKGALSSLTITVPAISAPSPLSSFPFLGVRPPPTSQFLVLLSRRLVKSYFFLSNILKAL